MERMELSLTKTTMFLRWNYVVFKNFLKVLFEPGLFQPNPNLFIATHIRTQAYKATYTYASLKFYSSKDCQAWHSIIFGDLWVTPTFVECSAYHVCVASLCTIIVETANHSFHVTYRKNVLRSLVSVLV